MVAIELVPGDYWLYWPGLPIAVFKHLWEALLQDPPSSKAEQNPLEKRKGKEHGSPDL